MESKERHSQRQARLPGAHPHRAVQSVSATFDSQANSGPGKAIRVDRHDASRHAIDRHSLEMLPPDLGPGARLSSGRQAFSCRAPASPATEADTAKACPNACVRNPGDSVATCSGDEPAMLRRRRPRAVILESK